MTDSFILDRAKLVLEAHNKIGWYEDNDIQVPSVLVDAFENLLNLSIPVAPRVIGHTATPELIKGVFENLLNASWGKTDIRELLTNIAQIQRFWEAYLERGSLPGDITDTFEYFDYICMFCSYPAKRGGKTLTREIKREQAWTNLAVVMKLTEGMAV